MGFSLESLLNELQIVLAGPARRPGSQAGGGGEWWWRERFHVSLIRFPAAQADWLVLNA